MSEVGNTLQGVWGNLQSTFTNVLNKIISPEKRAEFISKIKDWAINNPKLAAFLTTQVVLSGLPLLLFFTFSITVGIFSLVAALLIGLLAAVLFTVFMVGVALVVVLPTVFFTTFAASFLFLWGLGGYYLFKWINEGAQPAEIGKGIGDKLNQFTGGRLSWLSEGTRQKQEDISSGVNKTLHTNENEEKESNGHANGHANEHPKEQPKKHSNEHTDDHPNKHSNEHSNEHSQGGAPKLKDQASKQEDGVQKKATQSGGDTANAASKVKNAT